QRRDDRLRDLVLQREDVLQLTVVALRPDMAVFNRIDQLRCDPHVPAGLAHAAFHDMSDLQPLRHLGDVDRLAFKVNTVARDRTLSLETFDKSVMMSSVIPSLKYSCSGSPDMLVKGSTAMEGLSGVGLVAVSATAGMLAIRYTHTGSARFFK